MNKILSFFVPICMAVVLMMASFGSSKVFTVRPAMVSLSEANLNTIETINELKGLGDSIMGLSKGLDAKIFNFSAFVDEDDDIFEKILGYIKGFFNAIKVLITDYVPYMFEFASLFLEVVFKVGQLLLNTIKMAIVLLEVVAYYLDV